MSKYYWLKIKKDFYKRHDIKIIEAMPNGVEYIWFYLKMMMESVDHEGMLRFNEFIPYDDNMLSVITGTNIDVVRGAMKVFHKLGMVEVMNDQTIYIETVAKMIGSETSSAERVRQHRIRKEEILEIEEKIPEEPEEPKDKKRKYGKFKNVLLTEKEYAELKVDYPDISVDGLIEYFSAYVAEKAYKSKSHNLAIRRWVVDAFKKPTGGFKRFGKTEQVPDYSKEVTPELTDEEKKKILESFKGIK